MRRNETKRLNHHDVHEPLSQLWIDERNVLNKPLFSVRARSEKNVISCAKETCLQTFNPLLLVEALANHQLYVVGLASSREADDAIH